MNAPPRLGRLESAPDACWEELGRAVIRDLGYPNAVSGPTPTAEVAASEAAAPFADRPSPLVRLFAAHEVLDAREAAEGLRPLALTSLERMGLVERRGTQVVARFGIERWGPIVVLHDWPEWNDHPDLVMGVSPAGRSLAWFTPRRRVERALDLGAGSGLQAILAATHATEVVAVDVNERAVELARASVRLNGLSNVEVRLGSWFEPVVGTTFDLVVSNPPFVISPEHRFVYRDGGTEGDDLCRRLLADLPDHLAPGGTAVMLAEWARRRGDPDWRATPRRWLGDLEADGLAIRYGTSTPREYAGRWNQFSYPEPRRREQANREWLEYYEELELVEFYEGVVALRAPGPERRRPPAQWAVPAGRLLDGPAGDQLQRTLDGHVETEGRSTDEILAAVARPVEGHSLYQEIRYEKGDHVLGQIRGGFGTGLGVDVVLAPEDLALVLSIGGERPLAVLFDEAAPGTDPDHAAEIVVALARAGVIDLEMTPGRTRS